MNFYVILSVFMLKTRLKPTFFLSFLDFYENNLYFVYCNKSIIYFI